ncbi:MAG: DUF4282 domain-containing protein [Firmicutes bacterium]|nr:DUF4282 domain-containing protein [Bacillota bacterium]
MSREDLIYPDGSRYRGEVKNGKRDGQGTLLKPDGTKYVGEWREDRPHGQGTITWADGRKYVGEWKNGKKHGYGSEIHSDGTMIEGEWEKGTFIREITSDPEPQFDRHKPKGAEPVSGRGVNMQEEGRSFFSSLFDITMREMITPKIIRVMYVIGIILIGIGALGAILTSIFAVGDSGAGVLLATIIAAPIGAVLGVIFLRIYLEIIILLFNIYDQLKEIKSSLR